MKQKKQNGMGFTPALSYDCGNLHTFFEPLPSTDY